MTKRETTTWTGLSARSWDCLGGDEAGDDYAFYLELVRQRGGATLDIGCGTGRVLLRLLAAGFDVDGVDTSKDMLSLCEAKACERGLEVRLFEQSMAELQLNRAYETILMPCGSFMLLRDDLDALAALTSLRRSLAPGGTLVFNCFEPNRPPQLPLGEWVTRSIGTLVDGSQVTMEVMTETHDPLTHVITSRRRYTSRLDGRADEVEYLEDTYRWFAPEAVTRLLAQAGFESVRVFGGYEGSAVNGDSSVAVFLAE